MLKNSVGLLAAGLPTLIGGTAISLLLGQNLPKSMLAGIATAASGIGVVALYGGSQTTKIRLLEAEIGNREAARQLSLQTEKLGSEKSYLESSIQQLKGQETQIQEQVLSAEEQLKQAKGQFGELKGQRQILQQQITQLTGQKTELERRLHELEQNNPDWKTRDQLQTQIEELRQSSNGLSGQVAGLFSEVERLEGLRRSLLTTEATLASKQAEFNAVTAQVEALQTESSQLAAQSAQLELLRNTYDGLLQERGSLEARITSLEPEKARLESELQRILQAIQENEAKYAQAEQIRREIQDLERQKRHLWSEVRELQADQERLEQDRSVLEARIKELKAIVQDYEAKQADSDRLVEIALKALKTPLWSAAALANSPRSLEDEPAFIQGLIQYIQDRGFGFSPRVIRAFHTSLKVQGISALVVLAGISGTGKSELPRLYAEYIGAQFLMLAVQPRWDSPQDLLGFYNYIENKFKPTPLIQGIYQYQNSLHQQDRIVLVLLDEMNLARVEYYFSEFLSKLESRRNHASETHLDIDLGSLPVKEKDRRFGIPEQFLFVGTMNEDETTQSLSDKVLDRANVLTFGKPDRLVLGKSGNKSVENLPYLTYQQFTSWSHQPNAQPAIVEKLNKTLTRANTVMEKMGHPFAHRVYQAIAWYVVNYPGVIQGNTGAFESALADQFAQKLLPKLRGVMVADHQDNLQELGAIIEEMGDSILKAAFTKAKVGHYGQFQWKGLVYPEEQGKS